MTSKLGTRTKVEAALAQALVEGAKLWIVVFTHRYGFDAWLRLSAERPDKELEIADIESWEGEDAGDFLEINGPHDLFQLRARP